MSVGAKQELLRNIEAALGDSLTARQVDSVVGKISDILVGYDLEILRNTIQMSDDCLKAFLDAKRIEGRSDKTIERYNYIIRKMLENVGIPTQRITTYHIRGYLMDLKEHGMMDSSIEGQRGIFSAYFGWLWKEGIIEKNPCANINTIKCKKEIRLPYSAEDIEKLKERCTNIRDKALICFLLSTGCRISELCGINRNDVDFVNGECTVLGKGNKERTVYLDSVAVMLLKRYIITRNDISPALFIGKGTSRMTPQGVRFMLKKLEEKAGVENVHPHRFRRTLATNLINRGMPIQEVAAILGHDKIDTTMRYVYLKKENVRNAYKKYA